MILDAEPVLICDVGRPALRPGLKAGVPLGEGAGASAGTGGGELAGSDSVGTPDVVVTGVRGDTNATSIAGGREGTDGLVALVVAAGEKPLQASRILAGESVSMDMTEAVGDLIPRVEIPVAGWAEPGRSVTAETLGLLLGVVGDLL